MFVVVVVVLLFFFFASSEWLRILVLQKYGQNLNKCTIHISFDNSSSIAYNHDPYLHWLGVLYTKLTSVALVDFSMNMVALKTAIRRFPWPSSRWLKHVFKHLTYIIWFLVNIFPQNNSSIPFTLCDNNSIAFTLFHQSYPFVLHGHG